MTNEQDCASIFGPKSAHSDYTSGQLVRSVWDGRLQTGEIPWTSRASDDHPLQSWVNGLTCLSQHALLGRLQEDEPVCPGCGHPVCAHSHRDGDLQGLACHGWSSQGQQDRATLTLCPS
jgi:hypothetical protein